MFQQESADVVCRASGRPQHSKLEKSSAKQTRTMNDRGTAPHHHQALEHEGERSVRFVLVDCEVQRCPEKADQQSLDKRDHVGRGILAHRRTSPRWDNRCGCTSAPTSLAGLLSVSAANFAVAAERHSSDAESRFAEESALRSRHRSDGAIARHDRLFPEMR